LGGLFQAAFGNLSSGTFIEVGAFDGDSFNNTCLLADLGWNGIYVEPVPEFAKACTLRHLINPKISVVNTALGARDGNVRIHAAGALSTASEEHVSAYRKFSWARSGLSGRIISVPMTTLDKFLAASTVKPNFDPLVVDVEGFEAEVFAGFSLGEWRPQMLIVELEDFHPDFSGIPSITARSKELRRRIESAGYVQICLDAINTVYRSRNRLI